MPRYEALIRHHAEQGGSLHNILAVVHGVKLKSSPGSEKDATPDDFGALAGMQTTEELPEWLKAILP